MPPHSRRFVGCGLKARCARLFRRSRPRRDLVTSIGSIPAATPAHEFAELAFLDPSAPTPWFYTGGFRKRSRPRGEYPRRHALWGHRRPRSSVRSEIPAAARASSQRTASRARRYAPVPGTPAATRVEGEKKPLASGGGRDIEPLTGQNDTNSTTHYYQKRVEGPSFSALYYGRAASRLRLIGVTRQWIGTDGSPFGYVGSVGPTPTSEPLTSRLVSLGSSARARLPPCRLVRRGLRLARRDSVAR